MNYRKRLYPSQGNRSTPILELMQRVARSHDLVLFKILGDGGGLGHVARIRGENDSNYRSRDLKATKRLEDPEVNFSGCD
jgi:hypothetical protein